MKKLLAWLLLAALVFHPEAFAADSSLPNLTATTAPASTDIFYVVVDPAGTPADRKVTGANLGKALTAVGKVAITQPATAATITVTDGKTLSVSNTMTLAGTDGSTYTLPGASASLAPLTSPSFTTPVLGAASGTSLNLSGLTASRCVETDGSKNLVSTAAACNPNQTSTVTLLADALYMQGCTKVTGSALVTAGLTEPYITCGDDNAHGFHRSLRMPDSWDGGTITVTLSLINVNAAPAGDYEIDFSAVAVPLGTALATTISTTGEQPVNIDFDAAGTCGGSACVQFAYVKKTSAAITVNGTPAGGNLLRIQGQVDATATTTTQVADVKITEIAIEYTCTGRCSD